MGKKRQCYEEIMNFGKGKGVCQKAEELSGKYGFSSSTIKSWLYEQCKPWEVKKKFDPKLNEDMAYIIGVLLGDGYAIIKDNGTGWFGLRSIDKDFCLYVKEKITNFVGNDTHITERKVDTNFSSDTSREINYVLNVYNTEFAKWMREVTNDKTKIPDFCKEYPKSFLQGLMDSDGSASIKKNRYLSIYLCSGDEFILREAQQLFKNMGVKVSDNILQNQNGVKYFNINQRSFREKMKFNVKRKNKKLERGDKLKWC